MEMICFRCGEPWSLDIVLHENKEQFAREGCVIRSCPQCSARKKVDVPEEERSLLDSLQAAAVMFGDDYDGFASFLEDIYSL